MNTTKTTGAAKKSTVKKSPVKKTAAAKKAPAKKTVKKAAEKKAPAKKTVTKKAPAKKTAVKKAVKKTVKTVTAKKAAPKKAAVKKAAPKKRTASEAEKKVAARLAESKKLLDIVTKTLDDDKAEDIVPITLAGRSALCDYIVIASGRSSRHVASCAENLARKLKEAGYGSRTADGVGQGDWALVDAGDVIVHIFRPEVRSYYDLEGMWSVKGEEA